MSDFVFVNNAGGGSGFLDFLNTVAQIVMAVCAFYVIKEGPKIYRKQKEIDRLHLKQDELIKQLVLLKENANNIIYHLEFKNENTNIIEKAISDVKKIFRDEMPVILNRMDCIFNFYFDDKKVEDDFKNLNNEIKSFRKEIDKILDEENPQYDYLIKGIIDEKFKDKKWEAFDDNISNLIESIYQVKKLKGSKK